VKRFPDLPAAIANLVVGDLAASLNDSGVPFERSPLTAEELAQLQTRVADGTISGKIAKDLLRAKFEGEKSAIDELIEKRGLKQISDAGEIEKLVDEVLASNAKQVEDYRAGKEKAFNSLVGQVMKASKGKANPAQVNELLRRKLGR
jgi:aspartyl-tRNA(Asn)/glutamyl-tRNA(Gln) amidotransferase subunit B